MIPWLAPGAPHFPPASSALEDPAGLLAAGGELSPDWLLHAYRRGIFPWFDDEDLILWWSPSPRMVLKPAGIHIARSLRKVLRQQRFSLRFDTAFAEVVRHCANVRDSTWILPSMQAAYGRLHTLGHAHSVEVYRDNRLVGGLYGVHLGGMFFGESMFSLESDASKVALVTLAIHAQHWGLEAIDCQMHTEHLARMGASPLPRPAFEACLNSCDKPVIADWVYNDNVMIAAGLGAS